MLHSNPEGNEFNWGLGEQIDKTHGFQKALAYFDMAATEVTL